MTPDALHFLRTSQTLGPAAATTYPRPLGSTRLNPYFAPGAMTELASGLPVLDKSLCGFGDPLPPAVFGDASLSELLTKYGFRTEGRDIARPGCTEQGVYPGFSGKFPQVRAEP
jgi:phospholipid/cholesterol/gamma-HCH transport system substrate-binding protein